MAWRESKAVAVGANTSGVTTRPATDVSGSISSATALYFPTSGAATGFYEGYPHGPVWDLNKSKEREMPDVSELIERWTFSKNLGDLTAVLPFRYQDKLKMERWRTTFLPTLATRTAEHARPRTVSIKNTRVRAFMERFSIGFQMTYADATTEGGKLRFQNGLFQMRDAIAETIGIYQLEELSTCDSPWRRTSERFKNVRSKNMRDMIENDRFVAFIFQRLDNAWQLLDTELERIQSSFNGKGDTYIIHNKLREYSTQVGDRQVNFDKGGPDAVARVDAGPNAMITDGRGNRLIAVKTHSVEGARPLDLLKRYITLGGFNVKRPIRRGSNLTNYRDQEDAITIYDVDNDRWHKIDNAYLIDNSARYDPVTGAPIGIESPLIKNRANTIEYDGSDYDDSYHYVVMDGRGNRHLTPAELMGQLRGVSVEDVFDFAEVVINKLGDLNRRYTAGGLKEAIDGGMALLREIENLTLDEAAIAAIVAERADYGLTVVSTANAFNKLIPVPVFAQDNDSTWPYRNISMIGYGSAAGFLKLSEADPRAKNFISLLKEIVTALHSIMPMNLALDSATASPWWTRATALHTFWDNVVVPNARFPYMLPVADEGSVSSSVRGRAVLEQLRTRSAQSIRYLNNKLMGNIAVVDAGENAQVSITDIQASIDVGPRGAEVRENTYELRYSTKQGNVVADGVSQIYDNLPAFAKQALGGVSALGGTARVARLSESTPTQVAFNIILGIAYGTISNDDKNEPSAREKARAMMLLLLNMVNINTNDPRITGARIVDIYETFIKPSFDLSENRTEDESNRNLVLAAGKLPAKKHPAAVTVEKLRSHQDAFVFHNDEARQQFVDAFQSVAGDGPTVTLTREDGERSNVDGIFAATPLVYSPSQLVNYAALTPTNKAKIALADVHVPATAMTASNVTKYADLIRVNSPALPAPLRPLDASAGSSGIQMGYLQRLLQSRDSNVGARTAARYDEASSVAAPMSTEDLGTVVPLSQRKRGASGTPAGSAPTESKRSLVSGRLTHIYDGLANLLGESTFAQKWEEIELQSGRGMINTWIAKTYMLSAHNGKVWKEWARRDLPVHVSALLFRWARLGTYSIIKVLSGESTGYTNWGNGMFTWCNDSFNRMYYSEMSTYLRPLVEAPENVIHADNVFSDEYLGGWGIRPFGFQAGDSNLYEANMPQPHLPSVFVSLEPYACRDYEGEISATGYLADVYGPGAGVARGDELGFANAPYFNAVYGFQKRVKDAFVSETSQNPTTFEAGSSPILAYREPTGYFDPTTKSFDLIDEGAGLFPTSMYGKGFKDMLNGKMYKAPKYEYKALKI